MSKILFTTLFILIGHASNSQTTVSVDTLFTGSQRKENFFNGGDVVLGEVKYKPEFPGGFEAWSSYLRSNIDLTVPAKKKAADGTYYVFIRFTVGKDSVLRNIGAESGCGYGMEDEVIKSLKASPKWSPAQTAIKEAVSFASRQVVIFKVKGTDISITVPSPLRASK